MSQPRDSALREIRTHLAVVLEMTQDLAALLRLCEHAAAPHALAEITRDIKAARRMLDRLHRKVAFVRVDCGVLNRG